MQTQGVSRWVERFAPLIPKTRPVLDLACGGGRHSRFLLGRGHQVVAIDRDVSGLEGLRDEPRLEIVEADLEDGRAFVLRERLFGAVVATNYLYRPLLGELIGTIAAGGVLLYETFARGNERFGRPSNPEFLLEPGELLDLVAGRLRVVAFEDLVVDDPRPAAVQRIAAVHEMTYDRG